jgi:hypothetical protein
MSNEPVWDEAAREELRDTLRSMIVGELRLARRGHDDILTGCHEAYVQDVCPQPEWDEFMRFAADELKQAAARLASEKSAWPAETDCDRLDRVEGASRARGIVFWQASPCCDTCTLGELGDRIHVIDRRSPGFRQRVRGYSFFIEQTLPESLAEATELSVYLAYGWLSPNHSQVAQDVYKPKALGIADEVCQCLRKEGFEPRWDGNLANKIAMSLNWQRRTMLE